MNEGQENLTPTIKELRHQLLKDSIPSLLEGKTILYVGAKVKKRWPKGLEFLDIFYEAGFTIDVLEIFQQNVIALRRMNKEGRKFINRPIPPGMFRRIYLGSVVDVDEKIKDKTYDVVMFNHGPEHLRSHEVIPTLAKLEKITDGVLIIGCPWGIYRQGSVHGNDHETHLSYLYPEMFIKLGFEVRTMGEKDVKKSHILAWKQKEKSK